jgi:hypothetical protein
MDEKEMQDALLGLISDEAMTSEYFGDDNVKYVESFDTEYGREGNVGIVLRLMDGSEFQITIVRSK